MSVVEHDRNATAKSASEVCISTKSGREERTTRSRAWYTQAASRVCGVGRGGRGRRAAADRASPPPSVLADRSILRAQRIGLNLGPEITLLINEVYMKIDRYHAPRRYAPLAITAYRDVDEEGSRRKHNSSTSATHGASVSVTGQRCHHASRSSGW